MASRKTEICPEVQPEMSDGFGVNDDVVVGAGERSERQERARA